MSATVNVNACGYEYEEYCSMQSVRSTISIEGGDVQNNTEQQKTYSITVYIRQTPLQFISIKVFFFEFMEIGNTKWEC